MEETGYNITSAALSVFSVSLACFSQGSLAGNSNNQRKNVCMIEQI